MKMLIESVKRLFINKLLILGMIIFTSISVHAEGITLDSLRFEGTIVDGSSIVPEGIVEFQEAINYTDVYTEATNVFITNWYAVYYGRQEFVPYSKLSVDAVALYIEAWVADFPTLDAGGEAIELVLKQGEDVLATGTTTETTQTGWVYIDLDSNIILQPYVGYTIEFNIPDGSYTYDGIHLGSSDTAVGNTLLGNALSGEINPNSLDIPFKLAQKSSYSVDIDIKPGNKKNVVEPRSKGSIWVAILSDTDPDSPFDPPSQVDIPTVEFGPDGAAVIRSNVNDVNKDGLGDLLLRFEIPDTGIACGDTEATLTGETFDGVTFSGTDSIKTVGCKPQKCHRKKHHSTHCDDEEHHKTDRDDDHEKQ